MFKPYGIIPPIITPFTEDGKFNEPVFRKMVNHLIEEGVHGVFPLGTTGEFYAFSEEEVRYILEVCKDEFRSMPAPTTSPRAVPFAWYTSPRR